MPDTSSTLHITTTRGTTEAEFLTLGSAMQECRDFLAEAERKRRTDLVLVYVRQGEVVKMMKQFNHSSFEKKSKGGPRSKAAKTKVQGGTREYKPRKKHRTGSTVLLNKLDSAGFECR